ncbi:MAG: flagellar motor switch protein FliN [Eisenbergiella sp.]
MGANSFSPVEIDAIGEILNISLGASATAASTMLDARVDITTPVVHVEKREEFSFSNLEPAVGVEITYIDGLTGDNVMLLKRQDVKAIVEMLMGMEIADEDFELNEMNISAICEVMNQMMGASATALSELLGKPVNISTPKSFEITSDEQFKDKYFTEGNAAMVVISFRLNIAEKLESEFMNLMPITLAKELVSGFFPDGMLEELQEDMQEEEQTVPAKEAGMSNAPQNQTAEPEEYTVHNQMPVPEEYAPQGQSAVPEEYTAQSQTAVPGEYTAQSQTAVPGEYTAQSQTAVPGEYAVQNQMPVPGEYAAQNLASVPGMDTAQNQAVMPAQAGAVQADASVFSKEILEIQRMQMELMEHMRQMETARQERKPKQIRVHSSVEPTLREENGGDSDPDSNLDLIMGVPVEVSVEIGRTRKLVKDILELNKGSLVVLDKLAGEQVDLFVNGQCIARGDVVVVDDNFGIRITQIVSEDIPVA